MTKVEDDCIASIPLSRRLQTKAAAAGLNISMDYLVTRQPSVWSASETDDENIVRARCRRPSTSSSQSSTSPVRVTFESPPSDEEDAWNLIPYNVPWGSSYDAYQAGTFPGPQGTSIFLRSPTPLKNQRTSQACTKCRERKAKCSGTRPACNRCSARGQSCHYDEETKRSKRGTHESRRSSEIVTRVASPVVKSNFAIHDRQTVGVSPLLHSVEFVPALSESPSDTASADLWPEDSELDYPASSMIDRSLSMRATDFNPRPVHAPQPLRHHQTTSILGDMAGITFGQRLQPLHPATPSYPSYHQSSLPYVMEPQDGYLGTHSSIGPEDFASGYHSSSPYSVQPTEMYSHEYATYGHTESAPRFGFDASMNQTYPSFAQDGSTFTPEGPEIISGYSSQPWMGP